MEKSVKENVYSEIVLRSQTGASLLSRKVPMTPERINFYKSGTDSPEELKLKLENVGFKVISYSPFGLSISGPLNLYKDFFKANVVERQVSMFMGSGEKIESTELLMDATPTIPKDIRGLTDSIYIPPKGYFLAGEGPMPTPAYYHVKPPTDIVNLTNADHAHSRGIRGSSVKVAMVDSGFIENHDYYSARGYNITVHAAVGSTTVDEYGHGTGIASNLLAIAPACDFHFYKMSDGTQWASLAAFRMAVQDNAKVITNSWGQGHDPILEAEIISAIANGITVVFACGNGGSVGWPGCMVDIISVGGSFPNQNGTWQASSYASSGTNGLHPNRHCPDFTAVVGQSPKGIFIVVPTMAGAIFDGSFSGGAFPNGDETGPTDGWMVASGTSSAAPMVAGAAALLLEAKSSLTPAEIKQTLADTCIDVVEGASASGESAGIGPDSATGAGRIDIGAAIDRVKPVLQCPRAPLVICKRAPSPVCYRAPIVCKRAPIINCLRAPSPVCYRAPFICKRAPIINCLRAPIVNCLRAPIIDACLRAPLAGCAAGPYKEPIDPRIPREYADRTTAAASENLVPVTVFVEKRELESWMEMEDYYDQVEDFGIEDEYEGFPESGGCKRGPFDPDCC